MALYNLGVLATASVSFLPSRIQTLSEARMRSKKLSRDTWKRNLAGGGSLFQSPIRQDLAQNIDINQGKEYEEFTVAVLT